MFSSELQFGQKTESHVTTSSARRKAYPKYLDPQLKCQDSIKAVLDVYTEQATKKAA